MSEPSCSKIVMVVEDDRDVREAIVEVLVDNEFRPIQAANGKEALEHLRADARKPCVILLDIMMPVMDGWQFRAVQRIDPELSSIPVVVLTAHASVDETVSGMPEVTCLKKPVQVDQLLAILDRFCHEV